MTVETAPSGYLERFELFNVTAYPFTLVISSLSLSLPLRPFDVYTLIKISLIWRDVYTLFGQLCNDDD